MAGSFSWMLLLLLPLFCFSQSSTTRSSDRCLNKTEEFDEAVTALGKSVETCPVNCSSVSITDKTCQCLNLNESQEGCAFPNLFIRGLNFLSKRNLSNHYEIMHLTRRLNRMNGNCEVKKNFCSLSVRPEFNISAISPKKFHQYLTSLNEQYNAKFWSQQA